MTVILILLALITGVGALLYLHDRLTRKPLPADDPHPVAAEDEEPECCGMHITCERDSLVAGIDSELLYYEDEELDRFRGRQPQGYTDSEIEEFREVLLTLKPEEIAGWARSIATRGIALPPEVRDELLMIVAEARAQKS